MDCDFSTSSAAGKLLSFGASSSVAAADDEVFEDSCSICLEPFTAQDPSTITTCKHEYHLQCILEWSQRSKECPICWQLLTLKDPNSQDLLDAVERERSIRSRISTTSPTLTGSRERLIGHDVSSDPEFDESFMRRLAALVSRDRDVQQRESERSTSFDQSGTPIFRSRVNFPRMSCPSETTGADNHDIHVQSSDGDFTGSNMPFSVTMHPPSHDASASVNSTRVAEKPSSPENSSFSDSLKLKLSSASARYKESISKSTRSLKDRILARNSVKELSKGVQREMSAGVARLIERLDLNSKQSGTSVSVPSRCDTTMKSPMKGEGVQEDITLQYASSNADVYDMGSIPGRLEVVPSQRGQ
ncbi:E3 ubiquitin-protein ligase RHF1A [Punica granatum]|uniref:RING-type E3 ubiquitin transferase n=2 Tax=Punica granatum TaxID=22663 RepID=A0A2I0HHW8_PUNGR|nr:E3 ubiquitin-protein ligase RHF1A [Punica granatum]PKI31278.1 hypothetical protein CRG98_048325 [Punica granatum]